MGGQQQDILWKGLNCFQEKDDKSESLLPPREVCGGLVLVQVGNELIS